MEIKVLSVINPISYLLCCGLKDVENRTWKTSYRGKLFIHSSGQKDLTGAIDLSEFPLDYYNEYYKSLDEKYNFKSSKYFEYNKDGFTKTKDLYLQDEYINKQRKMINLVCDKQDIEKPFWRSGSIIGCVDLVDIKENFKSDWSEENNYQWIIKNPVLFNKPVVHVKGKLRLWKYDLKYKLEELEPISFK